MSADECERLETMFAKENFSAIQEYLKNKLAWDKQNRTMTRKEEIIQAAIKESPRFAERRVGFITGAMWADSHPHWISVEDELPEEDGVYLFFDAGTQGVYVSFFWADLKLNEGVTHWMPMPAPPKKGGEQ